MALSIMGSWISKSCCLVKVCCQYLIRFFCIYVWLRFFFHFRMRWKDIISVEVLVFIVMLLYLFNWFDGTGMSKMFFVKSTSPQSRLYFKWLIYASWQTFPNNHVLFQASFLTKKINLEGQRVTLAIWDTAGIFNTTNPNWKEIIYLTLFYINRPRKIPCPWTYILQGFPCRPSGVWHHRSRLICQGNLASHLHVSFTTQTISSTFKHYCTFDFKLR